MHSHSDLRLLRSGHCTKLKPEYEAASEQLKGVAKLVAVDATAAQGLAQQFGIEGFPTIKVFPKGKKNVKKFEDYNVRRPHDSRQPSGIRVFSGRRLPGNDLGCVLQRLSAIPALVDMSCVQTFVLPALTVVRSPGPTGGGRDRGVGEP